MNHPVLSLQERVRNLISDHLGVPIERVTDTASLIDDLGTDSLDRVELIMACEEEFGIEIPDDNLENVQTPADVIRLIERLIALEPV